MIKVLIRGLHPLSVTLAHVGGTPGACYRSGICCHRRHGDGEAIASGSLLSARDRSHAARLVHDSRRQAGKQIIRYSHFLHRIVSFYFKKCVSLYLIRRPSSLASSAGDAWPEPADRHILPTGSARNLRRPVPPGHVLTDLHRKHRRCFADGTDFGKGPA